MRVLSAFRFPSTRRWHVVAAALLLCAAGVVQAQSDDNGGDPPARVARLSFATGDLGFMPAGASDWTDASINRPLTNGDKLSSGPDARAELELGGASLRIAGQTDVGVLNLSDQLGQFELTQGTLNLNVRDLADGQSYEIDTPTVALVVNQPGTFRVDIGGDGSSTTVTAFRGVATVYGENGAQREVDAGSSYAFDSSALDNVAISDIDGGDSFDAWCSDRDRRYDGSATRRYVSTEVVGAEDLDNYGDWRSDPDYGAVWYPTRVAVDWAPYRDGHWAWIAPWGWTWVDDSAWGFAPYHYGRWAWIRGAWGWVPCPPHVRPVYAPALVAFVGGGGWNLSIGVGGPVGWFPLGPREVYNPWYHASRNYYTNVNVTNINIHNTYNRTTIINNINNQYVNYQRGLPVHDGNYANRNAPRGFTAMPAASFASAAHVQSHLLHVDPRQLAAAPVLAHGVDVRPSAASLAPPRNPRARALPASGFNRQVVARHAPPPAFAGRVAMPNGRSVQPLATPRAATSNVRLLGPTRTAQPVVANDRGRPANPREMDRGAAPVRVITSHEPPNPPTRAAQPFAAQPELRNGELPSSRFVHRPADMGNGQRVDERASQRVQNAPRPGVSYIAGSSNESRPAPQAQSERTLPQVPRIVSAHEVQPVARNNEQPRLDDAPRSHEYVPQPAYRPQSAPHYEAAPRPMPQQSDNQRYQPEPRAMPDYQRYQPAPRQMQNYPQYEPRPVPAAHPQTAHPVQQKAPPREHDDQK